MNNDELSLKNLELFQEAKIYAQRETQKTLFLLSTGTFVISVTFIGYLRTKFEYPWILIGAWVCLGVAILMTLRVHWLSMLMEERKLKHTNDSRKEKYIPMWDERIENDKELKEWNEHAWLIIRLSILSMTLGLILLFAFAAINLLYQNGQSTKNSVQTSTSTKA